MFDESVLIKCLTERTEDARTLRGVFKPDWLNTVPYRPILKEIYTFLDEYGLPPSIATLHQIFQNLDDTLYQTRYKKTLNELEKVTYDLSSVVFTLQKARDVAKARSLKDLVTSALFNEYFEEDNGVEILKAVEEWKLQFHNTSDETELDIKEAINKIVRDQGFVRKNDPIPCGIDVLDEFSGGGIKPKNLAIIIAPSKSGKSISLMNIGYHIASVQDKNVLFVTNELTTEETAERFASRITGIPSSEIQRDMAVVLGNPILERHWQLGLNKRLRILEKISEFSTDFIESAIAKYVSLYSWSPDVIVVDYMERMRPTIRDVRRSEQWDWLGATARDLMRLAKKGNYLVWTAAQTNRKGFDRNQQLGAGAAQGSIKHLQEASFVVGQRKRKTANGMVLEFEPILVRHAPDSERVFVSTNFPEMRIGTKVDVSPMDLLDVEEKTWKKRKKEESEENPSGDSNSL